MLQPWFLPGTPLLVFPTGSTSPDVGLACRLLRCMQQDPVLRPERICIEVQNRVVILEGAVSSAEVKSHAHRVVWESSEVRDVNNRLRICG